MLRTSLIVLAGVGIAPLVAGVVDAMCYFWFDAILTGVRWKGDDGKTTIAVILAGGGIAAWVAATSGDDDP